LFAIPALTVRKRCARMFRVIAPVTGYFFADAENWHAYRIYVREKCHKYLKAIDSRSAGSKTITLWERIKTRTLERYVESMGYTSGWKVVVYD